MIVRCAFCKGNDIPIILPPFEYREEAIGICAKHLTEVINYAIENQETEKSIEFARASLQL